MGIRMGQTFLISFASLYFNPPQSAQSAFYPSINNNRTLMIMIDTD